MALLSGNELERELSTLDGWRSEESHLVRVFLFRDFAEAFGWMASVALAAEAQDHHPNWTNVYNRVEVQLWSHDVGGVTERDLRLARRMNALFARGEAAATPLS
jgi:4a-hydroxytetrahydrobiopterin dehydratase